jgi:hypothetical protein
MSRCPQSTPVAVRKCSRVALTQLDNQIESLVTKRKLNISKTETPEIEQKSKMPKFDTKENSIDIVILVIILPIKILLGFYFFKLY